MPTSYLDSASDIGNQLAQIKGVHSFFFITDENCSDICTDVANPISNCRVYTHTIKPGEASKNISTYKRIATEMAESHIDRTQSIVIGVGGGVVTDLAGFVAATFKRGVRFISIPTSLMAMVDAAHGGKTGINLNEHKNFLGQFYKPEYIYICTRFLESLPSPELQSGFAEVLKHGLALSQDYWREVRTIDPLQTPGADWLPIIHSSIELKTNIVEQDFKESGVRKKLNFGHTVGHAIESHLLYKGVDTRHGHCVAAGMIVESHISKQQGLITASDFEEIERTIFATFPKLPLSVADSDDVLRLMQYDKKNVNTSINFCLLSGIGSSVIDQQVEKTTIEQALGYYINS